MEHNQSMLVENARVFRNNGRKVVRNKEHPCTVVPTASSKRDVRQDVNIMREGVNRLQDRLLTKILLYT
jgi:hypothetical protein